MMAKWTVERAVNEVRPGVFFVEGPAANWVLVTEPASRRFTLIDSGYPGDRDRLLASMAHVGRTLEDCAGLLVTHGHSDHIGSAAFLAACGVPVYAHSLELANVRREVTEQITLKDLGWRVLAPRVLAWALHAVRAGGLGDVGTAGVRPLGEAALRSLPGGLRAVPTGGHTSGHTAYFQASSGALASGDAVISGHAISPVHGPQLLPAPFHADPSTAGAAAARAFPAALPGGMPLCLLPGHGPFLELPGGMAADGLLSGDYWPFGGRPEAKAPPAVPGRLRHRFAVLRRRRK